MLKLAVATCLLNTSLKPVVIATSFLPEFKDWLSRRKVECHEVESSIADAVHQANNACDYPLHAIGNYLRYEACRILEDEFFLYCDGDVIFLKNPLWSTKPALFSAAPERELSDERINSGVLLINNWAFRERLPGFFDFARRNLVRLYPGFDQPAINEYFAGQFDRLCPMMNWRAYWGSKNDVSILHLHAFRPNLVRKLLAGYFIGQSQQRDLLIELTEHTLRNLGYFLDKLEVTDELSDLEHFQELLSLRERSDRIFANPVRAVFNHTSDARIEMTAMVGRHRQALIALADQKFVPLKLAPKGMNHIRVLIQGSESLLAVSDLLRRDGVTAVSLRSSISANLNIVKDIKTSWCRLSEVEAFTIRDPIDIVFRVPDGLIHEELYLGLIATTSVSLDIFRGDGINWSESEQVSVASPFERELRFDGS